MQENAANVKWRNREKRNYQEHEKASFFYLADFYNGFYSIFGKTSYSLPMWLVTIMLFVPVGKRSNSRSQMFDKIGALKNLPIFTGKRLCWSFFK